MHYFSISIYLLRTSILRPSISFVLSYFQHIHLVLHSIFSHIPLTFRHLIAFISRITFITSIPPTLRTIKIPPIHPITLLLIIISPPLHNTPYFYMGIFILIFLCTLFLLIPIPSYIKYYRHIP